MEAIPDATEEETALVPHYLREMQEWLRSQGKSDTLVKQTTRNLVNIFEDDGKSIPSMTTLAYFELVKASPKNITSHNQRSSAIRNLQRFWEQRPPGPPEESGDVRSLTPKPRRAATAATAAAAAPGSGAAPDGAGGAPGSAGAAVGAEGTPRSTGEVESGTPAHGAAEAKAPSPGSVGAAASPGVLGAAQAKDGERPAVAAPAAVESRRDKKKRQQERDERRKQKKLKKEKERGKREPKPEAPLVGAPGVDEVLEQAKQLAREKRLATGICLVGRDAEKKNASMNGVYLDRGKLFHGRSSFKKEGGDRFLFFSSTKSAWKVSNNLNDAKTGFAFAKVEDRGQALPSDPSRQLVWRACDGKEEGYKKDTSIRCIPASVFLRKLAPEFASAHPDADGADSGKDSDGEQGSDSSSCQQGSEHTSDDEKGTMSSSSSSSSGDED